MRFESRVCVKMRLQPARLRWRGAYSAPQTPLAGFGKRKEGKDSGMQGRGQGQTPPEQKVWQWPCF